MIRYELNTQWDDPYEGHARHRQERRGARRFPARLRIGLAVEDAQRRRLVGPGLVEDLSAAGASLRTKHRLVPDNRVMLEIPTDACPGEYAMPSSFTGTARVIRVKGVKGKTRSVALAFGDDLLSNMEFALFVNAMGMPASDVA